MVRREGWGVDACLSGRSFFASVVTDFFDSGTIIVDVSVLLFDFDELDKELCCVSHQISIHSRCSIKGIQDTHNTFEVANSSRC